VIELEHKSTDTINVSELSLSLEIVNVLKPLPLL